MASGSSLALLPTSLEGYRQTGIYGGLKDVEFATRCPPDVQKNTRIVAVCGISDLTDPEEDGWFFSDFFLFYQMLGSRPELPNQLWLSSCSPSDLISKHKRYLHGPTNGIAGDRRIVMNEELLPEDELKAGFRVFRPKDLLEAFLTNLKSEIKEAARTKQPVLVLIFGHGEIKTSGIFIGCNQRSPLILNQEKLAFVLEEDVQTTMVLSSSYSGGWIIKPNFNKYFSSDNFDFKEPEMTSLSSSLSRIIGRQAGGRFFATCLINSIITTSDGENTCSEELNDKKQPIGDTKGRLIRIQNDDEGNDILTSDLARQIANDCEAQYGSLWENHSFSFAAQDDLWVKLCGNRTGYPLLSYMEKWETLPEAPLVKLFYLPGSHLAGSMSKSLGALNNFVRVKATRYMYSNPGADNRGCNTNCHSSFYYMSKGAHFGLEELYTLNEILDYRQGQIGLAEVYCYKLQINVPKYRRLQDFNEDKWLDRQYINKRSSFIDCSKAAIDLLERFDIIHSWIVLLDIFDSPRGHQGYDYSKPKVYLAARLAESSLSIELIHQKLKDLVQYKLEDAQRAAHSPLGAFILNQDKINTMRIQLYNTTGRLKHRLRSL